jgi:RHS repeat-associated protein
MNHISGFFGSYWAGLWTGYAQNQHGQWTQYQTPAGLTTLQYDNFGFPSQTVSQNGLGSTAQDLRYQFNSTTGNLSWRRDALKNFREDFTYDGDLHSRLTGWSVNGQPVAAMQYLSNGNISQKTDVSTAPASYRYEHPQGKPHAVTSVAQPTTAFLNAAPEQNITYTPFNKVSFISDTYLGRSYELDITYGPDQQRKYSRLEEDEGVGMPLTTETYFLDQYETKRMLPSTEQKIHYLSGPTGLFGIMVQTGSNMQLYYVLTDYLGSITGITDASGNVLEKLSYDPWGRRRNPNNWTDYTVQPSRFDRGYTGHEHLDQFGLINMNGRVYDPFLARFLSPDPFVQAPEYSQNYNRYSYAWNNPLKYTDPSGEFIHLIIGAAIGGLANLVMNWNKADNFWDGLGYFAIGAGAGALAAGTGAGFGALASGAGSFSFMSAAGLSAPGLVPGLAVGVSSGFTSGLVTGSGNGLIQGESFKKALGNGFTDGVWGAAFGGFLGGTTGYFRGLKLGLDPITGFGSGGKFGSVPDITRASLLLDDPVTGLNTNGLRNNGLQNLVPERALKPSLLPSKISGLGEVNAVNQGNRAFFSGAGMEARAIEEGFQTLGQTRAGQNLQNLIISKNIPWKGPAGAEEMWKRLSATLAKGVPNGSTVPVFLNNPRAGSIWFQTELPILQSKGVHLLYK